MDTTGHHPTDRPVTAVVAAAPVVAERHFLGRLAFETDVSDVARHLDAAPGELLLLDTRSPAAFASGHLPGALSLPHPQIDAAALAEMPAGALMVTYCWGPACNAATKGAARIAGLGRPVKEMIGGFDAWVREGFPVETESTSLARAR